MTTPTRTAEPTTEMRLVAAQAEIEHLRGRNADLTRRINGALHLLNQFDPMDQRPEMAAVLVVDLRYTLDASREASR